MESSGTREGMDNFTEIACNQDFNYFQNYENEQEDQIMTILKKPNRRSLGHRATPGTYLKRHNSENINRKLDFDKDKVVDWRVTKLP